MAVLTNARIFYAGYDVGGQHNRVDLTYQAEALDSTTFGTQTRTRAGGLKVSRLTGAGFFQAAAACSLDQTLFDSLALTDAVVMIFPETILAGATSTGSGWMFKVTQARYQLGGTVGELLPFTVDLEGRGVD